MSTFNEAKHPRATDGKFTKSKNRELNITLQIASRNSMNLSGELGFKNRNAATQDQHEPGSYLLLFKEPRQTEMLYRYDARTETALDEQGNRLNVSETSKVLAAVKTQQGSTLGIERIKGKLKEITCNDPRVQTDLPTGAVMLSDPIYSTDSQGNSLETVKYIHNGRRSIVTAGSQGAVEIWEKENPAMNISSVVVHAAEPLTEHMPTEMSCVHTEAGYCYPDSWTPTSEQKALIHEDQATLAHLYNEIF